MLKPGYCVGSRRAPAPRRTRERGYPVGQVSYWVPARAGTTGKVIQIESRLAGLDQCFPNNPLINGTVSRRWAARDA
jgi:hypothetical protein